VLAAAALCSWLISASQPALAAEIPTPGESQASGDAPGKMTHMQGHMHVTSIRPQEPADQARADAIVLAAKAAMDPYRDYRKALAEGYKIFLPNVPQRLYHFTNYDAAWSAHSNFDPGKPTSLLYTKTAEGGYRLVGVMYTARLRATEAELNARIPLSIARWHQHINFCKGPSNEKALYLGPRARFGLLGSITTKEECTAAGGTFYPHIFGWMVHVYPYEKDPKRIWSTDDADQGHDNMDHTAAADMKAEPAPLR
jgi:hypothetical protein